MFSIRPQIPVDAVNSLRMLYTPPQKVEPSSLFRFLTVEETTAAGFFSQALPFRSWGILVTDEELPTTSSGKRVLVSPLVA